jgi:hypothetical protein
MNIKIVDMPRSNTKLTDNSTLHISAHEVKRLAIASIAEIDQQRQRYVDQILAEVMKEEVSYFFGLAKFPKYSSKEQAMALSPEVGVAQLYAEYDRQTCILLQRAAQYMLDQPNAVPPEERYIQVSLNDFRALT